VGPERLGQLVAGLKREKESRYQGDESAAFVKVFFGLATA
jgi:hypothetical protein